MGLNLEYTYNLSQNSNYESVAKGHKLTIEVVDEYSGTTWSEEIDPETLKVGTSNSTSMEIADDQIVSKVKSFSGYKLNIYDTFENHKKLLYTGSYNWFTLYE